MSLSDQEQLQLIDIAKFSIIHGLDYDKPCLPNSQDIPLALNLKQASFVTLLVKQQLRGCIGHLDAIQPLAVDVAQNAYYAAFKDTRFTPLTKKEWPKIEIHLSILSLPKIIKFSSEQNLIEQLVPYQDGLILEDQNMRATFLPSVWKNLPEPDLFLQQLKLKAGFQRDYWSDTATAYRYSTEIIIG